MKVENANLQVLRHLRAYLFDQHVIEDWTKVLSAVINSTIYIDIRYSSHEFSFGQAMNLNRFVLEQQTPTTVLEGVQRWDEQLELHNNILEKASRLQKEVDEKRIEKRTSVPTTYSIGSYVLVEYPRTIGNGRGHPPKKLQTIRKGSIKVVIVINFSFQRMRMMYRILLIVRWIQYI